MRARHPNLGQLRGGKPCPAITVLDRLRDMDPRWRVSWRPGSDTKPGLWILSEFSASPLYREAGLARRKRYLKEDGVGKLTPDLWYGIEDQIDGLHYVASFTDEQFGTEWMFHVLRQDQHNLTSLRAQLDLEQWRKEHRAVEQEQAENAAFREYVRTKAEDDYRVLALKAHSVVSGGLPSTENAS